MKRQRTGVAAEPLNKITNHFKTTKSSTRNIVDGDKYQYEYQAVKNKASSKSVINMGRQQCQDTAQQDKSSPYRSRLRINQIMLHVGQELPAGGSKLVPKTSNALKQVDLDDSQPQSKPSSVSTAIIQSITPNGGIGSFVSGIPSQEKPKKKSWTRRTARPEQKVMNKEVSQNKGKRSCQYNLEMWNRCSLMPKERIAALLINLFDSKGASVGKFNLYNQKDLQMLKSPAIQFDMSTLEVEYDYETDNEQLITSQKMLRGELESAIDFFIEEDPLKLVTNVLL